DAHAARRPLECDLVVGVGLEPAFAAFDDCRHDETSSLAASAIPQLRILSPPVGTRLPEGEARMEREGGCACGAVRYRLTAEPLIVHACHCRDCQRLSGGAFALNIWIERRFVESADAAKLRPVSVPAGSG